MCLQLDVNDYLNAMMDSIFFLKTIQYVPKFILNDSIHCDMESLEVSLETNWFLE